jgi:hypothetical protein
MGGAARGCGDVSAGPIGSDPQNMALKLGRNLGFSRHFFRFFEPIDVFFCSTAAPSRTPRLPCLGEKMPAVRMQEI